MDKSVLIAVPCMSHVPVEFMSSFAALDVTPNGAITMESGSLVYKARNNLAEKAILGEFDYVMWIDSDMVFGPDLVSRMLEEAEEKQLGYLTALAFTRGFPVKPIIYETVDWEPKDGGGVITGAHTYMELIKRDDALEAIRNSELGQEYDEVEKVPSVDAVPVVRCKDCKHRPDDSKSGNAPRTNCPLWCGNCYGINDVPEDFYCKYGERREGENNG